MKFRFAAVLGVLALLTLVFTSVAFAGGNSPAKRSRAGWACMVAGPHGWVHCFPPGAFSSTPSVAVQVFDTDDPESTDAPYLGTELLLRADLYAMQPCAQNGGGEYELLPKEVSGLPVDYRACHHFDTSH